MAYDLERLRTTLAGRYRIERELGRGGMATVYLAQDLKHERRVAIKVLQPELAAALGPERFLREIKLTAQLNHPHILPLLDSGEAGEFLYYVMPYVEGESLRERLKREKQLPVEQALQIAREVADALDYAHRHDLVHRDIKPENILLEEQHAVVADFGIARAISAAGGQKLTATGVAVGTPEYMSPEQASGSGELDGRTDIYALGCVLYEMLAGEPPFTGPTVESLMYQHLSAAAPEVSRMRRAVPADIVALLRRALEKAPADRPATGAAFVQALQVVAGPPPRPGRTGARRAVVGLTVGAVALIPVLALWRRPSPGGDAAVANVPPRLVVLPFENLGRAEDEYFADGMTEEITSRLAQVPGLAVIGRTSAMQYKGGGKSLRTIGEELQVQYVLEGTVRWSIEGGERLLRITPQLIRVADEAHVWADRYDAVFADVFAVQGRIASQVVAALGATFGPGAAAATDVTLPTRNIEAYERYLRGNTLHAQCAVANCAAAHEAAQEYEAAVRLDPDFAAAWARLSHATMTGIRPGVATPARAREAAARAMALAPDLPDAHIALGRLYYDMPEHDLPRAEASFRRALQLQPNHLEGLRWLGLAYRRAGNMEAAADVLVRHADLDPRDERAQYDAGITYLRLRRYEEAERFLQRHITLGGRPVRRLATLHLMRDGDTVAARRVMMAPALATPGVVSFSPGEWWYNAADGFLEFDRLLCDSLCARVARDWLARSDAPITAADPTEWRPYGERGVAARLAGDQRLAEVYLDSALRVLEIFIKRDPTLQAHSDRAGLLAWLGREEAAIQRARELVRRDPITEDATNGPGAINTAAEIFALFGEDEEALKQLEVVLSAPSYNAVPMVRLNPVWRRFHNNPRFQALVAKYETTSNK